MPTTKPPSAEKDAEADKAALEAKPDEARMSAVAKRLLATKPDRQATDKALTPTPKLRPRPKVG